MSQMESLGAWLAWGKGVRDLVLVYWNAYGLFKLSPPVWASCRLGHARLRLA